MSVRRYLTKSRFKLATECPTKLFYTGKKHYANQSLEDTFLQSLAEGGFQVGELAKCYFPDGHDITTLDYNDALSQTNKLLQEEKVVIYEAAFATDNLFVRVDILVKNGNYIDIYEVKAKSFDLENDSFIGARSGEIRSGWKSYLDDVAFQKYVINQAFPNYTVSAHLTMADKSTKCPTDGLNQKFLLVKDKNNRTRVKVSDTLNQDDLNPQILINVDVDHLCEQIYSDDDFFNGLSFKNSVAYFAENYANDIKIKTPISSKCASCEFYTKPNDSNCLSSGKKECWQKQLRWSDEDFETPTALDIWNFRNKDNLIESGCIKMTNISLEDINPEPDDKPGISASERRWLQVEKVQNNDNSIWLDKEGLQSEIDSWIFPLHFIDFETAMAAIPFNAGRRPYEGIAFQFSHHTVYEDGTVKHTGEYLNTKRGIFTNYEFVRQLKLQLENDNGTIFRYSNHENTFLNLIFEQLQSDENDIPDRRDLCDFIMSITQSKNDSANQWVGERNMVDMWDIVKRYYYDPATNGSNSIKDVLPAILNSSTLLQEKYSKPIYGAKDGIFSHNFKNWQWVQFENNKVIDPYKLLPNMFNDISDNNFEKIMSMDELRDGGAALTAYSRMQYEEMSQIEFNAIKSALLKYCELDTMAMVMIYEGWLDLLANYEG